MKNGNKEIITQHLPVVLSVRRNTLKCGLWQAGKRFMRCDTYPNFCFAKTSFMLKILNQISLDF